MRGPQPLPPQAPVPARVILNGAHTFPEVKEATRAGTGACGGKRGGPPLLKLFAEKKIHNVLVPSNSLYIS